MKHTPLRKQSRKMARQRRQEVKLSLKLAELSDNCCEICGQYKPINGLHKHEIIKRSHHGNEIDPLNCLLLGGCCHNHVKYPISGTPLSIEEQLELAKKLHSCLLDKRSTL